MKNILIILIAAILFVQCKNQSINSPEISSIERAKKTYQDSSTNKTALLYITEIKKAIPSSENKMELLIEGHSIAEKHKLGREAISFLTPLVKEYPDNEMHSEHLAKLSSVLLDLGKKDAGSFLALAYMDKNPNGKFDKLLSIKMGKQVDPKERLTEMANLVFENPDKYGINRLNAQKYVDACEAFCLAYPNDTEAPLYLYRAGEMARSLKTYTKTLSIYDWLIEFYPEYEKTPTTIFLKGFLLENELKEKEKARKVYEEFLEKYKNHDLTDDVKFLLSNIDKSDEEIMKDLNLNEVQ